jgi:DNA-binding NarL/FixJ family response regulator
MSGVRGRIFGRTRESAAALAFLDSVADRPVGFVVEGAPGIGKTTVWRAALDEARARGLRTLACTGDQAETRLSLTGVGDLLDGVTDDELRTLPGPQREALEHALLHRGGSHGAVKSARRIGSGLRTLLVALAASVPVVIAVDDLQWLDAPSAAALAFALRRIGPNPVGVLATVRPPTTSGDPLGLERALGDEDVTRLRLGPLGTDDLRELIEARLRYDYPEPVMARIAAATDGNPLFALEVARALGAEPARPYSGPLPVPDSLREIVRARVQTLGVAGRQALLTAAALARPSVELVERAASADGLAEAEEAGLVRVDDARITFEHPLYASAVYGAASTRRRRATHLRLADLVPDREERARHLALGTVPPDARIAAELDAGAAQARARGAWGAAAELLELARTFTPDEEADARQERAVRAAEHHIHGGDRRRARWLLDDVLAGVTTRTLRCEALRLLGEIHGNDDSFAAAGRCYEEALDLADTPAERIVIHMALAYVASASADFAAVSRHADLALRASSALGDPALVAEALAVGTMAGFLNGDGIDRAAVERALAAEDPARVIPVLMRPCMIAALMDLWDDRFDEARARLLALCRHATDSGDESDLGTVLYWLAWLETQTGDLATAIATAEQGVANAVLTGSSTAKAWGLAALALGHAERGDAARARSAAAEATAICEALGLWTPMLWVTTARGLLELSLGDAAAAWQATRPMTEQTERDPIQEPEVHQYLPVALEALVQLGQLDRAERLVDWFEGRARAVGRRSATAHALRARGLLLAARGDLEGAEQSLAASLDGFERLSMPFEVARTLLALGRVLRRRRQRRGARDALQLALSQFEGMGAAVWAERTREELALLPHAPTTDVLTATERRVVAMASEGLSNKEIARDLFVTVSTIEVHLSHAYAKLGVHSRTRLAALVREWG